MATFAFIVDIEEGHLFPTFGLSKSLKARGHIVHYIGTLDVKASVLDQGFYFHAILEHQYPLGFLEKYKEAHRNRIHYGKFSFIDSIEDELPRLLEAISPDGIIMSTYLCFEALLLKYRWGIAPVIFMPTTNSDTRNECRYEFGSLRGRQYEIFNRYRQYSSLKNKKRSFLERLFSKKKKMVKSEDLEEFILPAAHFEQVIACPEEFALPEKKIKNIHYLGPCIRNKPTTHDEVVENLKSVHKKVIYLSLGSQTQRIYNVCESLYHKIFALMDDPDMNDFHLLLSSGSAGKLQGTTTIPDNVTVVEWADSLRILEIAAAIITHGGLGLVKESIYNGVPMIVLPDKYDQPLNADRVEELHLGVKDDLTNITKEALKSHLRKVTTDPLILKSIQRMKALFRQKEEQHYSALIVEGIFGINGNDTIKTSPLNVRELMEIEGSL